MKGTISHPQACSFTLALSQADMGVSFGDVENVHVYKAARVNSLHIRAPGGRAGASEIAAFFDQPGGAVKVKWFGTIQRLVALTVRSPATGARRELAAAVMRWRKNRYNDGRVDGETGLPVVKSELASRNALRALSVEDRDTLLPLRRVVGLVRIVMRSDHWLVTSIHSP